MYDTIASMQPEVLAAYIGGGGALSGVILGIAGTLAAARIQARGATDQANAARDAATTQAAAVLRQQARDARRPVYARALAAGRAYKARAELCADGSAVPEALDDVAAELEAAVALVELEGPHVLENAAAHLLAQATVFGRFVIDNRAMLRAVDQIRIANRTPEELAPEQVQAANRLEIALGALRLSTRRIDPHWRRFLVSRRGTEGPEMRRALRQWAAARPGMPPEPSDDDVSAFQAGLDHAQASVADALSTGLLTTDQARELLHYCSREEGAADIRPTQLDAAVNALERALAAFRSKAQAVLHEGEDTSGVHPAG
ncbi:hypothetical protein [Streptomyces sp. NBC_01538]|uniref:hypothetical protein n=1 Tax=Streptomyces sp. NBC_01538 TaxID=2903897 RepID=UPI003870DC34